MTTTALHTWTRSFVRTLTVLSLAVAGAAVCGAQTGPASTMTPLELVSYPSTGGIAPGCKPGFVWRDARDGDGVCVTPAERDQVHIQNANADTTHVPGGNGCRSGYVWRDAWDGDGVCVTPYERDLAHKQNAEGASHSISTPDPVGPSPHPTTPKSNPCPVYDGIGGGSALSNVSPTRYFSGTSPELGARWDKCAATVTVYFRAGVVADGINYYNLRVNGAQREVTSPNTTKNAQLVLKDSDFAEGFSTFTIQACHRGGFLSSSTCSDWSPNVRLGVHVGSISQG